MYDIIALTCVFVFVLCLQVSGWLEYHPTPSPPEHIPSQDGALVSLPLSMEPTKVQSEGGLNVTLTIRLLMHGKVSRLRLSYGLTWVSCFFIEWDLFYNLFKVQAYLLMFKSGTTPPPAPRPIIHLQFSSLST